MTQQKFAIRFGLGAIKAVGFNMMQEAIKERQENGDFSDIYDFATRLDPRSVNKKSIEALGKAGAFINLNRNRRQIAESFDILSSYSAKQAEEAASNQMSLFAGLPEANVKPKLKQVEDWDKQQRLQKEFEAFGFFLNEHPLDDNISALKKRGVIFSQKLDSDTLEDSSLVKMAGVVAASKHRSGSRGRFAYLTISDPYGIFEAMIFDEAIITEARDLLEDGSIVALECLIRKDDGGTRILIRSITTLEKFINSVKAKDKDFEDIKKQPKRNFKKNNQDQEKAPQTNQVQAPPPKNVLSKIEIIIKGRDPIFAAKPLLSQLTATENSTKTTTVIFSVISNKNLSKIQLPQKYLIDQRDVAKIRNLNQVIDVEVEF